MAITVRCDECGETFEAPSRLAGGVTECSICGEETVVPKKSVRTEATKKSAADQQALKKVGLGLTLIFWGLMIPIIFVVLGILDGLALNSQLTASVLAPLSRVIGIVCPLMTITGQILCLFVPSKSQAAGIVYASVGLQAIAILCYVMVIAGVFNPPAELADPVNRQAGVMAMLNFAGFVVRMMLLAMICWLAGNILFVIFLSKLATYLNMPLIAKRAMSILYMGGGVILGMLIPVAAPQIFQDRGGLALILFVAIFITSIVAFVRYLTTVWNLRTEIKATT